MSRQDSGRAEDSEEAELAFEGDHGSGMKQGRWRRDLRTERWVFGSWEKVAGSMGC